VMWMPLKLHWACCIIMPMNKTMTILHLEKKIVYESYKLPSEWQRLKDNFVGIIQQI
jgi:hypothetical protein